MRTALTALVAFMPSPGQGALGSLVRGWPAASASGAGQCTPARPAAAAALRCARPVQPPGRFMTPAATHDAHSNDPPIHPAP
jgi:hypothetical protein